MSEEELFHMIDKRRKSKNIKMNMEEMQKLLLED